MLFAESWLRSIVNPAIDTTALADLLTMAGLEIEEVKPVAPPFSGVIVARIESIEPHPDANKLRVCKVNTGTEILQIVCGAPNAAAGLTVPLATMGAVLPNGIKISKGKLRGVESFGMLCSATEIGLTQDYDGLLILDPTTCTLGQDIRDLFHLDENVFELKITPNRADCLSLKGIAREVAALTHTEAKPFDFTPVTPTITDTLPVHIKADDLCGRFTGRVIRQVNAAVPTPAWMKERLERAGMRSVSVLVDISNYVMLELGTPSHIFDLAKLPAPELSIDWSVANQAFTCLTEQELTLDDKVGVVLSGGQAVAMAGVMGGLKTAVDTQTTDIMIEMAFWHPAAIAGITRRFKLNSEAAHRFERGVDFACLADHLEYLTRLIVDICGGQVGPVIDEGHSVPQRSAVSMRLARCHKVLGMTIPADEIIRILTDLQFNPTFDGEVFTVQSPSWRFDIEIEEDLIEEVARVYGFDRIPAQPPLAKASMVSVPENYRSYAQLRAQMVAQDYQEVINFSFVPPQWEQDYMGNDHPIRLLNPIAQQLSVMRSGLIAGLVDNVVFNANRQYDRVRVFEMGAVFARDDTVEQGDMTVKGVRQTQHLAGVAYGPAFPEQWGVPTRSVDFFDVKADVMRLLSHHQTVRFVPATFPALHPGRCAAIDLNGQTIGFIGELHPNLVHQAGLNTAPVVFELTVDALTTIPVPQVQEYSKQPVVVRDLAIWAPLDLPVQALLDCIQQSNDPALGIIQHIQLFDIWRDPQSSTAERSLAFHFALQDTDKTLADTQVEQCMAKVLELWVQTYAVRLR